MRAIIRLFLSLVLVLKYLLMCPVNLSFPFLLKSTVWYPGARKRLSCHRRGVSKEFSAYNVEIPDKIKVANNLMPLIRLGKDGAGVTLPFKCCQARGGQSLLLPSLPTILAYKA